MPPRALSRPGMLMNSLPRFMLRQAWPRGDLDLLLKTVLLPDAQAAECWQRWKARRDLDDVTWEEHKLLAPVAARLASIDPACPYRPRLQGLAKAHWTQSQLMLRASAGALDILLAAGLPVMLLKGGSLQAVGLGASGPRISGDLDILVPRALYPRAIALLYDHGWAARDSSEYAQSSWRFHSGLNLRDGRHGDIDVHHQPVHAPWLSDAVLDAFWRRARPAVFHGRSVLVPSPADMIVLIAAHAMHPPARKQASGAWAFDLAVLMKQDGIDLSQVADDAVAFGAVVPCLASLTYLQTLAPLDATARLIEALEGRDTDKSRRVHFYAGTRGSAWSAPLRRLAALVAGRPKTGFEREKEVVPRVHRLKFHRRNGRSVLPEAAAREHRFRHEFDIGHLNEGAAPVLRRLIVEVEFERPPVARRFRFDLSAGGVPVARLAARPRPLETAPTIRLAFAVPLPRGRGAAARIAIEALAEGELQAHASQLDILRTKPVPFRVVGVAGG